jgi:hypothetical protein
MSHSTVVARLADVLTSLAMPVTAANPRASFRTSPHPAAGRSRVLESHNREASPGRPELLNHRRVIAIDARHRSAPHPAIIAGIKADCTVKGKPSGVLRCSTLALTIASKAPGQAWPRRTRARALIAALALKPVACARDLAQDTPRTTTGYVCPAQLAAPRPLAAPWRLKSICMGVESVPNGPSSRVLGAELLRTAVDGHPVVPRQPATIRLRHLTGDR